MPFAVTTFSATTEVTPYQITFPVFPQIIEIPVFSLRGKNDCACFPVVHLTVRG